MTETSGIRPSPIAGTWYSNDSERLKQELDGYLQHAKTPSINGRVMGVISPHAGYRYSGKTAGHAFRAVSGQSPSVVVIFSPYHDYHPAAIISSAHTHYETPLGSVPVAVDLLNTFRGQMSSEANLDIALVANDREHSLEIELPFLQRVLKGEFSLLPLMIRSHNVWTAKQIGRVLAPLLDEVSACLLVASTDLSHFYPEETAQKLDKEMLRRMASLNPDSILEAEETGVGFACGAGAVAAMLCTAQMMGANAVQILHHSTSAEVTGDRSQVVGYGAAAVLQRA